MSYQLVAIDLDGTLLNDDLIIPQENIDTIRQLHAKGITFVLVTGRPDPMTKRYVDALGIPIVVLASNGSSMRRKDNPIPIYTKPIAHNKVLRSIEIFKEYGAYFRLYSLDTAYSFNEGEFDEATNTYAASTKRLVQHMPFRILQRIEDIDFDVLKMFILLPSADLVEQAQAKLIEATDLSVVRGGATHLDLMAKGVCKGEALRHYAHHQKLDLRKVIAIGDNYNDLSMLELVGMPVAMGNAEALAKDLAKLVTTSNNQAGVAHALRQIFRL